LAIAMVPMMAANSLAQTVVGIGPALLLGWAVFLSLYLPLTWLHFFKRQAPGAPLPCWPGFPN
jgi:hypothetical protein